MRIADTLSGREAELEPGGTVRIYLCGVTVYDDAHIGHARTIVVFDVLRRYLEYTGLEVELVQNFTDVDDKIIGRAASEGASAADIGEKYIERYHRDFDALRVKRASAYPRATEHIGDMVALIGGLVEKGAAYVGANGVYFAVSGFSGYGRLSGKKIGDLQAGARVEADATKRDPLDFALWKFADSEPRWDSPWGPGRPGWHIECSAMSLKYLGGGIDIHGGGRDLIFPHHENEIAQSEAHTGRRLARIWMHVGMVTIGGQKMSKSVGNVRSVGRVLADWGPNVARLFCLSGHYSKPVDYSEDGLRESLALWRQVETAYFELICARGRGGAGVMDKAAARCEAEFARQMEDDLNTHGALSAFLVFAGEINKTAAGGSLTADAAESAMRQMEKCMDVLGLHVPKVSGAEADSICGLVAKRDELRRAGRYAEADKIRGEMSAAGIELLDHGHSTSWVKRERVKVEASLG